MMLSTEVANELVNEIWLRIEQTNGKKIEIQQIRRRKKYRKKKKSIFIDIKKERREW